MQEQEIQDIVEQVYKRVETKINARLKSLESKIVEQGKVVDDLSGNLNDDRLDISEMKVSIAAIEQSQKELIENSKQMGKRIVAAVIQQTNAIIENASEAVAEQVEPILEESFRKIKKGLPLGKKKPWWKVWR